MDCIKSIVIISVFCALQICGAQIDIEHFTTENGLPHDKTYNFYQDKDGYIWICTDNGLGKFNGKSFEVYNDFTNNFVIDVTGISSDTLAVATWGGGINLLVNKSIIKPSSFKRPKHSKIIAHGKFLLTKDYSSGFLVFDKYFFESYIGYIDGVNDKLIKDKYFASEYNFIFKKINDELFVYNHHLVRDNLAKGIKKLTEDLSLINAFPFFNSKEITDLGKYNESLLYAVSKDYVYLFDEKGIKDSITTVYKKNEKDIERFASTTNFEIFILTDNSSQREEVLIRDRKNDRLYNFNNRFKNETLISDIFIDKDDNIWIATYGNGVFYIPNEQSDFIHNFLENKNIVDVFTSKNNISYFLDVNSIYKLDKGKFSQQFTGNNFNKNFKNYNNNEILIQKENTLYKNDPETLFFDSEKIRFTDSLVVVDNIVKRGSYTSKTLNHPSLGIKKIFHDSVVDKYLNKLYYKNNELWITTFNDGLHVYNYEDMQLKHKFISKYSGLSSDTTIDLIFDKGNVWVTTSKGIDCINVNNKSVKNFSTKNGLISNSINSIFMDQHGILWVGTQNGVSIIKNNQVFNYNTSNGLKSSSINKIYEDFNCNLWITGNKGAQVLNNVEPFSPESKSRILVEKKKDKFYIDIISFGLGDIVAQYSINDNEWLPLYTNFLDFSDYKYGVFQVKFRARKINSTWSISKPYYIIRKQPWYMRIQEIVFGMILLFTIILLYVRKRLEKSIAKSKLLQESIDKSIQLEKELAEVRDNMARDFHDELGNKLAGITAMTDIILRREEIKGSNSETLINQIKKDAKVLYFGIRDFIWCVGSKSDNLVEFMDYLTDFGEELFINKGIIFNVKRDVDDKNAVLPSDWSRQLLLMFQEIMTNTLKHSKATKVNLSFKLKNGQLSIQVFDNGKGFDIEKLKRKNGLINIKLRAKKLNGTLLFNFLKGTKITFSGKII